MSNTISLVQANGHIDTFTLNTNTNLWQTDADVTRKLTSTVNGWQVNTENDETENYNSEGQLTSIVGRSGLTTTLSYDANNRLATVTGPFGHTLSFAYNAQGFVSQMTDPAGQNYAYTYDANNNLISVTYPGGAVRQYLYENTTYPTALTGIIDENGKRYATFAYDSEDRAISSEHAGGADKTTLTYNADNSTTVVDPLGNTRQFTFTTQYDLIKPATISNQGCSSGCGSSAYTYNSNGFLATKTDANGVVTTYTRDSRGLELSRTEASGTPQARTITTTWHATYHLPLSIADPGKTTTFTYDANGNLLTRSVEGSGLASTWTYTYSNKGQVLTETNPLGKTTSYTYNDQGGLASTTNALGQTINISSYDANGRPLSITAPNGLTTTLTYDVRGRLTSLNSGSETTTYTYDPVGNLTKTTLPDGSWLDFIYDDAHRLVAMADALGNRIAYTLDAAGNRTKEETFGNGNQLARTRSLTYDQLNRIISIAGTNNQTVSYGYDANGNLVSATDPLNQTTTSSYDALNRLVQHINPAGVASSLSYNSNDLPVGATDQRGLQTTYAYDGLGRQSSTQSPDTGATTRTFDAAGRVLTATDARGQQVSYSYDDLGRMTGTTYSDGSIGYQYDQGTNGIGHLTTMTDPGGTTTWQYDSHGRVVQRQQTANSIALTTGYQYDAASGRLTGMTYPSGKQVTYTYNNAGQITGIMVNGTSLLSAITYQPFGGPASWTQGNSRSYGRSFDLDGKITGIAMGTATPESMTLTYDAANRITQISDTGAQTVNPAAETATLQYAANSNQLLQRSGNATQAYTYDAAGNTTGDGSHSFAYDGRGRLVQVTQGTQTTTYRVNGLGQRVAKNDTRFVYDESGHLLGEYDAAGVPVQEIVWLSNLPVGLVTGTERSFISPDHLGAPHVITNETGAVIWRWDHDPYGTIQPNRNPSNLGEFVCNLRFPGQYYDQETGLHYNYYRDYNPTAGRYIQSDPIGLNGGWNTYGYVGGNPVGWIDPKGSITTFSPESVPYLYEVGQLFFGTLEYIFATGQKIYEGTQPCVDDAKKYLIASAEFLESILENLLNPGAPLGGHLVGQTIETVEIANRVNDYQEYTRMYLYPGNRNINQLPSESDINKHIRYNPLANAPF